MRDIPASALDGVDGVIHLAGLSNDPTAEYDPQANWQMNAIATESLGRACVERGIERFVFASSCSLYDGLPPGMHDERRRSGRGGLRDLEALRRGAAAGAGRYGLCPVILRNGTVYGWSPRMRFDLVVNTFVKDALLTGALKLHGGGWMWRPLVDVKDVADAMIAAYEAPADLVRGEIFNVLHSNYQIRELAMLVAGSVQLPRATGGPGGGARARPHARLRVLEHQACPAARVHPGPLGDRGGGRHAGADRRRRSHHAHRPAVLQHPLDGAPARGRPARAAVRHGALSDSRVLITGARGQLGSDLSVVLAERGEVPAAGRDELDVSDDAAVAAAMETLSPTLVVNCAAFHNVDVCEREEDRSFEVNARAVKRLAQACAAGGAKLVHFSTNYVFDGSRSEPYEEDDRPSPQSVYAISKLAGEHAALAYAPGALVVRTAGLYGEHGSESKGGNFVTRMMARAREQGALRVVADQ